MNTFDEWLVASDSNLLDTEARLVLLVAMLASKAGGTTAWTVKLAELAKVTGMDNEAAYNACYDLTQQGRIEMTQYRGPRGEPVLVIKVWAVE